MKSCDSLIVSTIVNGGPSVLFTSYKSLRQGDHFSSLLFILIMEALNRDVIKANEVNLYMSLSVGIIKPRCISKHDKKWIETFRHY